VTSKWSQPHGHWLELLQAGILSCCNTDGVLGNVSYEHCLAGWRQSDTSEDMPEVRATDDPQVNSPVHALL
jgi:hypothetical protein